jgi:hypothetical protein
MRTLDNPGLGSLSDEGMSEDIAAASVLVDDQPCELAVCQQFVEPVAGMADDFKGRAGQATRGGRVSAHIVLLRG